MSFPVFLVPLNCERRFNWVGLYPVLFQSTMHRACACWLSAYGDQLTSTPKGPSGSQIDGPRSKLKGPVCYSSPDGNRLSFYCDDDYCQAAVRVKPRLLMRPAGSQLHCGSVQFSALHLKLSHRNQCAMLPFPSKTNWLQQFGGLRNCFWFLKCMRVELVLLCGQIETGSGVGWDLFF